MLSEQPSPKDLSHHFSRTAAQLCQGLLQVFHDTRHWQSRWWSVSPLANSFIKVDAQRPNHYFPFDTLEASVALPNRWKPTPNDPVDPPSASLTDSSATRILVPRDSSASNMIRKIDLSTSLQYGRADGYPSRYSFIRQFTREYLHPNISYRDGAEVILVDRQMVLRNPSRLSATYGMWKEIGLGKERVCYVKSSPI